MPVYPAIGLILECATKSPFVFDFAFCIELPLVYELGVIYGLDGYIILYAGLANGDGF